MNILILTSCFIMHFLILSRFSCPK